MMCSWYFMVVPHVCSCCCNSNSAWFSCGCFHSSILTPTNHNVAAKPTCSPLFPLFHLSDTCELWPVLACSSATCRYKLSSTVLSVVPPYLSGPKTTINLPPFIPAHGPAHSFGQC